MPRTQSLRSERQHLLFLDGLRGLAALYVVACHTLAQITLTYPAAEVSHSFLSATKWLIFGPASVEIFIVLSGFCLMIPVVRAEGVLRGGMGEFIKRRSRRILPPYYAAVILSLLLIAVVPALSHPVTSHGTNTLWAGVLPVFTAPILLSHLFLIHNFSGAWIYKIGYPLWSIATEWQIYFIFAVALLPVWRRFGSIAAICAGYFIGYLPRLLFHHHLDGADFRLVGLFSLGMGAAALAFSKDERSEKIAASSLWVWLSGITAFLFITLATGRTEWLMANLSVHETLIGISSAALLLAATRQSEGIVSGTKYIAAILRVLELRPVVVLGTFSYSLYLIHAPLIALIFAGVACLHFSAPASFLVCEIVGVPLVVCLAYGFHLIFERPFMSRSGPKTEKEAEVAAIASPAP